MPCELEKGDTKRERETEREREIERKRERERERQRQRERQRERETESEREIEQSRAKESKGEQSKATTWATSPHGPCRPGPRKEKNHAGYQVISYTYFFYRSNIATSS